MVAFIVFLALLLAVAVVESSDPSDAHPKHPHLKRQGASTQLIVGGRPFLILGGELNNSSSSCLEYMAPIWGRMVEANLNTLIIPLSWELVEPSEGSFEFGLVDALVGEARRHGLKVVFLWLASWKNGTSSYVPLWVKRDFERFPRVRRADGTAVEVLSAFAQSNWQADARAFAALMRRLRQLDEAEQTVVMVQVENEVGVLGDSRDRSPQADAALASPVPEALLNRLRAGVVPEFASRWQSAGGRLEGTWEEVFGEGNWTDEAFMAWHYARYCDAVAAAGKAEYPLPMYVNAWLNEPTNQPGDYPSGGPQAHLLDVWQAGAPNIDLIAPDIYAKNFPERCQMYHRQGNPLFIPEMHWDDNGARNVFYAIGQHDAIGTSPFAIDRVSPDAAIAKSYAILGQIAPNLLAHQGLGRTTGFVLNEDQPMVRCELDGYELEIARDAIFGYVAQVGYGLIVATGDGEFLGAGSGFMVTFKPTTPGPARVGLGTVDEGTFKNGEWVSGRRLNGDETDQGQHWRFASHSLGIQCCTVYRYE